MLAVNIVCVGKIKESYFRDAIAEYSKRLGRFCKLSILEVDEELQKGDSIKEIDRVKQREGERIISKLSGFVIALDSKGKELTSNGLAEYIENVSLTNSVINFVIGGSNGLSDDVRNKADNMLSFGKVTYPHQLMRVILTEQIYRAFMINSNSAYHK